MKLRQESERQPAEMRLRLNGTSDEGREKTSIEVQGVYMMRFSVDTLIKHGMCGDRCGKRHFGISSRH